MVVPRESSICVVWRLEVACHRLECSKGEFKNDPFPNMPTTCLMFSKNSLLACKRQQKERPTGATNLTGLASAAVGGAQRQVIPTVAVCSAVFRVAHHKCAVCVTHAQCAVCNLQVFDNLKNFSIFLLKYVVQVQLSKIE